MKTLIQVFITTLVIIAFSSAYSIKYNIFYRIFLSILAIANIYYFSYLLFERYEISITIILLLTIYFIKDNLIKLEFVEYKKYIILNIIILFYMGHEVYLRELIAGDALAVYYLKAKAMYYGIEIYDMPTASYSIYPSSVWLLLSSYVGIENGAQISRYFFPFIGISAIMGVYFELNKKKHLPILIYATLIGYLLIRIGGHYPITMGYFDWLVGLILMYITYVLLYMQVSFNIKIPILLTLSCIGLVKLEGIIYMNIIFFVYLISNLRERNRKEIISIILTFLIMNLISISYVLFIKAGVGKYDHQVFKFEFNKNILDLIKLLINELIIFAKESYIIILIYIISIRISKNKIYNQFIILLLIFTNYIFIYYFNTVDLDWHIKTSFQRLLYQAIPLLMLFSYVNFKDIQRCE